MRKLTTITIATALLGTTLHNEAKAQSELVKPLPNVLLLVDTSGSMEYKTGSHDPPVCDPDGTDSERSRWIQLVEVLTGTILDYSCDSVNRNSSAFRSEYQLGSYGDAPDYQYRNPYHRPLSNGCAMGPSTLPSDPFVFTEPTCHDYSSVATACSGGTGCAPFKQKGDGLIDSYSAGVRFGLMTFDSLIDASTGYGSEDYGDGAEGAWSYFLNDTPATGYPPNCSATEYEVGARNAAAPPWEGKMIGFGNPNPTAQDNLTRNAQIEKVLLTTRPFGATPIAPLLADAYDYFYNDDSDDPQDSSFKFGPRLDSYVANDCREQFIILLSDGEPNLDLRPFCEADGGSCPYRAADEIAADFQDTNAAGRSGAPAEQFNIPVYVIGFALEDVEYTPDGGGPDVTASCNTLLESDLLFGDSGLCSKDAEADNEALQACCTLNGIAQAGGTDHARFASSETDLATELNNILAATKTRLSFTAPAVANGAAASGADAASYRFFSSALLETTGLWSGELQRERWICVANPDDDQGPPVPQQQDFSVDLGDDYIANVNDFPEDRFFVTIEATSAVDSTIPSDRTIRPNLSASNDGVPLIGVGETIRGSRETFRDDLDPEAMQLDVNADSCDEAADAEACKDLILNWLTGIENAAGKTRCPQETGCNLVGPIIRSTPITVGRPSALIADESYDAFKLQYALRPLILYTSSNDGFLHAFKVAKGDPADDDEFDPNQHANNELWAFMPPAVLTGQQSQYPGIHQVLLDGAPVVKDVVAEPVGNSWRYQRTEANARFGLGQWRTVLVQAFGGTRAGYFAVDVTNPVPIDSDTNSGPQFLWQITTDSDGNPLFGAGGGTPLITTVFVDGTEIAVAVLPGGSGGARVDGGTVARAEWDGIDDDYPPRTTVAEYEDEVSRSLTIVRLDTGEILRTFRHDANTLPDPEKNANIITEVAIDSPITGQPVAFPSEVGAVADRLFVGDQNGGLWTVDVSSEDPEDWSMRLFFDAYPFNGGTFSYDETDGQPVATRPIVSVDGENNLVVLFSTGDQESLSSSDAVNQVFSLTETRVDGEFVSAVNWYKTFTAGERVTGNMVLFSSQLFFSTYKPPGENEPVCSNGTSLVYAMDFVERQTPADPSAGGYGRWDPPGTQSFNPGEEDNVDDTDEATVFGVTLVQQPSCSVELVESADPYLGYGSHTSVTQFNPGKFQLIMHTGSRSPGASNDAASDVFEKDLETPSSIATFDSWAAIVE